MLKVSYRGWLLWLTVVCVALSAGSVLAQAPRLLKEVSGVRTYGQHTIDKKGVILSGYVENPTENPVLVMDPEVEAKFSTRTTDKNGVVSYSDQKLKLTFKKLSKGFLLAPGTRTPLLGEEDRNGKHEYQGLVQMEGGLKKVLPALQSQCQNSAFKPLSTDRADTIYQSGDLIILAQVVAQPFEVEGFSRYDVEITIENKGTAELAMPTRVNLCYQGQLYTEAVKLPGKVKPGKSKDRAYEGLPANFVPSISAGVNF